MHENYNQNIIGLIMQLKCKQEQHVRKLICKTKHVLEITRLLAEGDYTQNIGNIILYQITNSVDTC